MSLYEVPMTWSAPDRVYHLAHNLRYTDPRPQVGYTVALQELKSIIRSAGLSYAVLRTRISSQEFQKASEVLIGRAHLVGECELCSNQSKPERNTRQNEQIYTNVDQDKQSAINGSEEGEEDVEALLAKWFPRKQRIFETPSESLMYYCEQLSDQPGWKAYMASTNEPPQSSWKSVYSHLIGYLVSIEASYNKLLIEGVARLFEPKRPSRSATYDLSHLLEMVEEKASFEGATHFFKTMEKNVIAPPTKEPADWCSAAYAVLTEMVDLIGPNDENPNYLANLFAWHKFEECMSFMPYDEKHTSRLLIQFRNQQFASVAEMEKAIDEWHNRIRADYLRGTRIMKARRHNK